LHAQALTIAIGERVLCRALELRLAAGEFIAVLGRNGCGKSLTLHTFAGLRPPASGQVCLDGQPLQAMRRRQIAQESLPLTALEAALLGRHPHLGHWRSETVADRDIAATALRQFGVADLADRTLPTLSGGEQRRAAMAALLTQQPHVFLLDEPTNHLDPHHQIEVMQLFRRQCAAGAGVIATLHDASLAERFADRVLMLYGDGNWRLGAVRELLNADELSRLYLTPISELGASGRRAFIPA
jgi:iron complex transport system ATP-binding protein